MDGHSQIMASENDEMAYQSQMDMSLHTPSSEIQSQPQLADGQAEYCTQQMEPVQNSDNIQAMHVSESQSVSDNNNDASNSQNELSDQIQTNDKCDVDGNGTKTVDIDKTQSEITNEENVENQEKNENENEKDTNEENDDKKEDKNAPIENTDEAESHEQNGSLLVESEKEKEKAQKDEEIDLNQCRVCMSSENLLDIFRIGDKTSFRICDLIMKIAPTVRISERDFLPHSICTICTERIETAYELRVQCEETDKFLRSKLKRSKRTRRAPAEFVIVDAGAESSSESDDDERSDDEFQISEDTEESSDSDSDSSYEEKKKRTPSRAVKRPAPPIQRKNQTKYQPPAQKQARGSSGVVYIKAGKSDDDSAPKKVLTVQKVPAKSIVNNRLMFRCNVCNRPCASAEALAQHRRTHADEKCNICSMVFKQRSALQQHMERHKNDPDRTCKKCSRVFPTKVECQRHIQIAHSESKNVIVVCSKCKRSFPNKGLLNTHKCGNDHRTIPSETSSKRKSDVDVLNLTTTYWSDSFSD